MYDINVFIESLIDGLELDWNNWNHMIICKTLRSSRAVSSLT